MSQTAPAPAAPIVSDPVAYAVALDAFANEVRGEVDIDFGEQGRFVLRPSYTAILEVEKLTGKGLFLLASEAVDGMLTTPEVTLITTTFIRAWGRATENQGAANADQDRIGELIFEYGAMAVLLRLAHVLQLAVVGGCKADGTPREGEAKPATGTTATPAAGSQASRPRRSAGRRRNSG